MNIEFREATTEDIDEIGAINRESIEELAGQSYSREQILTWISGISPELYPIESTDAYFLLAERDGDMVGFGWMKPTANDYLDASVDSEITGMYVHPSAAGSGVGSRLYDRLERFAREQDSSSTGLWSSLNAVSFYEKQGYVRVTQQALEYPNGIEVPVVEMQKRLD
jgi:putative acetyltransferase